MQNFSNYKSFDEKSKTWRGFPVPYPYPPNFMFGELIMRKLNEIDPKKVLQICADDDSKLTCAEFKLSITRVAQNLIKIGVRSDDVIGLVTHNSHLATILINGAILIGAPISPIDVTFDEADVRAVFSRTKPRIIICDEEGIEKVENSLKDVDFKFEIYSTSDDSKHPKATQLLKPTNEEKYFDLRKFVKPADKKIAAIICTSGTTGSPKGCIATHSTFLNWGSLTSMFKPRDGSIEKSLCFSPIYWGTGLGQSIMISFGTNLRIFSKNGFSVENTIKIIEKYEITSFTLAPSALALLLNSKEFLSSKHESVKQFMVTGSIVSNALRKRFEQVFPDRNLMVSYGMTEVGVSMTKPGEYNIEGAVGSIMFPNTVVKIVDEDGKSLGPEEEGEICAKSNLKFAGYYKNPEASEEAVDDDGFIKTGDLGYFNKDGVLCVVDRKKNILKYKGYHFNPSEIENEIQQMEGVVQVSVVGLQDELLTSATAAAIIKAKNSKLTSQDVIDHIASKFPVYKQLHGGVYFFDKLPMTPSEKVIKRLVTDNILKIRETRE